MKKPHRAQLRFTRHVTRNAQLQPPDHDSALAGQAAQSTCQRDTAQALRPARVFCMSSPGIRRYAMVILSTIADDALDEELTGKNPANLSARPLNCTHNGVRR